MQLPKLEGGGEQPFATNSPTRQGVGVLRGSQLEEALQPAVAIHSSLCIPTAALNRDGWLESSQNTGARLYAALTASAPAAEPAASQGSRATAEGSDGSKRAVTPSGCFQP